MKPLNFWFGQNISVLDQLAISEAVQRGVKRALNSNAQRSSVPSSRQANDECAWDYGNAWHIANRAIAEACGWPKFSPLGNPKKLTPEQQTIAFDTIKRLIREDKIHTLSGKKVEEYLRNALSK